MIPKARILDLPTYKPGKPLEEVQRELELQEVIKMASNENPFGCSDNVLSALIAEKKSYSLYPESTAPNLRNNLAERLNIDPKSIIVGNGSDEIVQLIARTYLESDTESIMADYTFPRYDMVTKMEGATSIQVPLNDGVHDLVAMAEAVTERTRVIWICNPNNPTGTVIDHDQLERFLNQLPERILVVIDEAYAEYVTDASYPKSVSFLNQHPRVLLLRTFSKAYGLAAFRVGYGIGCPDVLAYLHRVRDPFNVNRLAQKAAVAALKDEDFLVYCRSQNQLGRNQIISTLDEWELSYFPSQASFILLDTGYCANKAFEYLLHQGIIVRSGVELGFSTHIRVTVGTKEQNERFLHALYLFLQSRDSYEKKNKKTHTISSTRR